MSENMPLPFNPRSPEFRANPYPTYDYLRTHHPIYYRTEGRDWVLTRYADMVEVLHNRSFGHPESLPPHPIQGHNLLDRFLSLRFSSQRLMRLWVILSNPPTHTRIRQLFQNSFTIGQVQTWRSQIQTEADRLIAGFEGLERIDIMSDLAYPLTMYGICQILGILPEERHPQFPQWSHDLSSIIDLDVSALDNERGLLAIANFAEYFRNWISKDRNPSQPHNHLISTLIKAQAEGQLSEEELLGNLILMFFAGHSTTKYLIGNSVLALLNHPEQLHLLQANPDSIQMAIAEVLRYDNPVQFISRTAFSDIQLSNQTIAQGQVVHCILAAGNRDPAQFPNPNTFDIRRKPNPHLSFGQGIHICLGKHLAQLVAEISVSTLVCHFPKLSLATESLEWEETFLVRGLKSLPVVL
ncbi:cytochrome P450 [Roseofilum sp. BLCC_M154]|uniref:Cytochrome P450 n=1 Tax=Roseofilum acuticapitatum BLCC-M154 TaxID=3022444 RepID=A0ABT7AQD3_9CYAN|nr:cytochrome P450 [Roseofilum acuticapitatum]MDJ1168787.1 cytochrome P450 [Roseofilum acuticapitatum BLCC-M154]